MEKRAKCIIGLLYHQFYSLSFSKIHFPLKHHSPPYSRVWVCHLGSSFSLSLILHWICSVLCPQKDSEILVYFVCWSSLFPQATYPAPSSSPVKTSHFLQVYKGFFHSVLHPALHPPSPHMSLRHFCPDDFVVPFCRTFAYFHSFLPSTIRLWNSLQNSVKGSHSISYVHFYVACKLWFILFHFLLASAIYLWLKKIMRNMSKAFFKSSMILS